MQNRNNAFNDNETPDVLRSHGTVKFFSSKLGYGFVTPSNPSPDGKDVFIHISDVQKSGYEILTQGQSVSYLLQEQCGKKKATNIRIE